MFYIHVEDQTGDYLMLCVLESKCCVYLKVNAVYN
jgi:hypothetical protein